MDKGIDSFNDSGSDSDIATNSQFSQLQNAIDKADLETVFFLFYCVLLHRLEKMLMLKRL